MFRTFPLIPAPAPVDILAKFYGLEANVKSFGAVGDGVTDDTAAFAAAFATGLPVRAVGDFVVDEINVSASVSNSACLLGGGPGATTIRPAAGQTAASIMFTLSRSDLVIQGIKFVSPISTNGAVAPAAGRVFYLANSARIWLKGCHFVGGVACMTVASAAGNYGTDVWIEENVMESVWAGAMSVDNAKNVYLCRNIIKDSGPSDPSAQIRIGGLTTAFQGENCFINENMVMRCNVTQEAIDLSCGAFRNGVCSRNLVDKVGGGGFEFKTSGTVADVDKYVNWLFEGNVVCLIGGAGLAINNGAGTVAPDAKMGRIRGNNNYFFAETPATAATGIVVSGAFDVELTINNIKNLTLGIHLNPIGNVSQLGTDWILKSNNIDVSDRGIFAPARTINRLHLTNNTVRAGGLPLDFSGAVVTGVESKGNTWETTAAAGFAASIRDLHDATFDNDTFIGTAGGVTHVGVASTNTRYVRCDVRPGAGHGFAITIGGCELESNTVRVPDNKRIYTGAGAIISTNNKRPAKNADPTLAIGGSVGDLVFNYAVTSPGIGAWQCTAAHDTAATYKATFPIL